MTTVDSDLYYDPYDFDIDTDRIRSGSGCATSGRSTTTNATTSMR